MQLISVHTPEFDYMKARDVVVKSVKHYGLKQPIYIDNDFAFWHGLGNHYWPAFYLVDREGLVRGSSVGEMHADTSDARRFENLIEDLLAEPPVKPS